MSVSIFVHWPGATEDDEQGHPGFFNDDNAWAAWLATMSEDPEAMALLHRLGLVALLSHVTDGMDADQIHWTTPNDLERAALSLRRLVEQNDTRVQTLLLLYAREASGVETPEVEFARDLGDVAQIAQYARNAGAPKVTLGYYW